MIKQMIVMRRDLHMRKGKIAAQAGHACVEATLQTMKRNRQIPQEQDYVESWLQEGEAKICVYVDGEDALLSLSEQLQEAGILYALIYDAGYTEFHGKETLTCLATEPLPDSVIDPVTGDLPLY